MPQNLRQEFQNNRLAAANEYLGDIADNFKEKMNNTMIIDAHSPNAFAYFKDACLLKVTRAEVLQMEGFAKLKRVCSAPDVDMSLGPIAYDCISHPDEPMRGLRINVAKPYSESGFLAAEKAAAAKSKPGVLRRMFSRLKGQSKLQQNGLPQHEGWVQSSPLATPTVHRGGF